MSITAAPAAGSAIEAGDWATHLWETTALAAPLALALLAEMAMGLISTLMLGSLGPRALAAGGLATNLFFTCLIILQGALSGTGVLAANAVGGNRLSEVPAIYWSGMAIAATFTLPLFVVLSSPEHLLLAMGQPADLVADIGIYARVLRWGVPAGLVGVGMMRQFLPAIGLQRLLLWVMPGGVALHAAMNVVLIHGGLGLPGFGFQGSAAAIVVTLSALALGMLGFLHGRRNFAHLVAPRSPRLHLLRPMLAIGLPVGATSAVEVGLFFATGILAGTLGPVALAAHMIALSVSSVTFMVPLSISQAVNVRVASAMGADNAPGARRAGFAAIALTAAYMAVAALVFRLSPGPIVAAYIGPAAAGNTATSVLAARLLRVAGMFQLFDGTQVTAAGALRGLQDTKVPMVLAALGYWGIGFWAGRYLAFNLEMGAVGLWWGLCAGLAAVALCLTARFAVRSG
jgi:MATE family multidrug resistance protein